MKIFILSVLICGVCFNADAANVGSAYRAPLGSIGLKQATMSPSGNSTVSSTSPGSSSGSLVDSLPSGLTFYKDYTNTTTDDADYSLGSPTATFTRTTDATHPATYIDANGVVQSAVTNTPRFYGGEYNASGFFSAKGALIETTATNLVPKSYTYNDATWTTTNMDVNLPEIFNNPGFETAGTGGDDVWINWVETKADGTIADETTLFHGGAHAAKITCGVTTNAAGAHILNQVAVTTGKTYTVSFWAAGDATNAGRYEVYGVSSGDYKVLTTTGITAATYGKIFFTFTAVANENVNLYFYGPAVNGGIAYFDDASIRLDNSVLAPDGSTNAATLTASASNATILLTTPVTAQTYSVWLKRKTGTGAVSITANGGTGYTTVTLSSSWARYEVTAASASQTCGIKIATSGDAVYAWGSQFENNPYMTSFIPTTNGALTRNADVLTYPTLNNRTAATETIIIKFMPFGGNFATGDNRYLLSTDTKERKIYHDTSIAQVFFIPNSTDSSTSSSRSTTTPQVNTSYVIAAVAYGPTASPNSAIYINGISEITNDTDYTTPAWGNTTYVGTRAALTQQLNGLIQKVAIFNRALSNDEIRNATNFLNN